MPRAEPELSSGGDELHSPITRVTAGEDHAQPHGSAVHLVWVSALWFLIPSPGQLPGLVKHGGLDGNFLNSPEGFGS